MTKVNQSLGETIRHLKLSVICLMESQTGGKLPKKSIKKLKTTLCEREEEDERKYQKSNL